jgi:signal-transduction protein with cAMP-binding, CBS, and nucleotidyltransferase domain
MWKARVSDIMERKPPGMVATDMRTPVGEVLQKMFEAGVGCVIVTKNDKPIGLFTEHDFAGWFARRRGFVAEAPIGDFMASDVVCVEPWNTVQDCMSVMAEEQVFHVPVIEEGRLVGVVSLTDCVEQLAEERKVEIRHLTNYITSRYPG